MLDIKLEIGQINYHKCIEALLPPLVEHCAAKQQPNELDRFLAKLGPDAAPAACAVLDEMNTDAKDKMVVWLVTAHEERMRNAANRRLAERLGGPLIRIGCLIARDRPGSRMTLLASQVAIDYTGLLNSPLVAESVERMGGDNGILKGAAKLALQMGAHMSPESLEKQGVALLNTKRVRSRLISVLADALCQAGLEIEVEDMAAEPTAVIQLPGAMEPDEGLIPDAFEEDLMDAMVAQLRKLHGGTSDPVFTGSDNLKQENAK